MKLLDVKGVNDSLLHWKNNCLLKCDNHRETITDIYKCFVKWTGLPANSTFPKRSITKWLKLQGFKPMDSKGIQYIGGIKIL